MRANLKQFIINRVIFLVAAGLTLLPGNAVARAYMSGSAELVYIDFDAKADSPLSGAELSFSGRSLAQRYSLAWTATNLYHRTQSQFYNVSLGYDWLSYDTEYNGTATSGSINESFGDFNYNGELGYNPRNLPFKLYIFANDSKSPTFANDIRSSSNDNVLIADSLYRGIDGKMQVESRGFSFEFDPNSARSVALRGLPRLNLDYRETFIKSDPADFSQVDISTKNLAVAGLVKGNNWITYRNLDYQDRIDDSNSFNLQQLQLGQVNYAGERLWTPLTNWMDVSADGILTNRKYSSRSLEEIYDVNFFARTKRSSWTSFTLMNYSREMTRDGAGYATELVESVRVPVYVNGVYGADTTWRTNVSFASGTQNKNTPVGGKDHSYSNSASVSATAFNRSAFTLTPFLSASISKAFLGTDSIGLSASLEGNSTARYSRKVGLAGRAELNYRDDGSESDSSKIINGIVSMKADYWVSNQFSANFSEKFEAGEETVERESGLKQYVRSFTTLSAAWIPTAAFSSSLQGAYDWRKNETQPAETETRLDQRLSYSEKELTFNLSNKYRESVRNYSQTKELESSGGISYRPDRHNSASVKYNYKLIQLGRTDYTYLEFTETYSYNFYTRTGENRNFATLSQEIGYRNNQYGIGRLTESRDTQTSQRWLSLSARYSPLAKLTLTGSISYQKEDPGSVAIYYGAGMSADFKLLNTSIGYAYAKRDNDNRVEKKLSAAVRRSF